MVFAILELLYLHLAQRTDKWYLTFENQVQHGYNPNQTLQFSGRRKTYVSAVSLFLPEQSKKKPKQNKSLRG